MWVPHLSHTPPPSSVVIWSSPCSLSGSDPHYHNTSLITVFQVGLIVTLHSPRVFSDGVPPDPHQDTNHLTDSQQERRGKILDNLIDFSSAVVDEETGLKCVRTEETLETVEREKLLSCTHSSINICHYTYVTKFSSFSPRVCEDVYTKRCTIVFTKQAQETTEEHCYRPWTKRCDLEPEVGEEEEEGGECRTVSETWCVTRYQEKGEKELGVTTCKRLPQTLCAPAECQVVQVRWN